MSKMAMLVVFAVCVVSSSSSIASATFTKEPFLVKGYTYCDNCRCGYETDASKVLARAEIKIECRSRKTNEVTFTQKAVTNSAGQYESLVYRDCGDDWCDAVLVKSSDPECGKPNAGRDRARVILTRNNGMTSNVRFANAMGFLKNTPLASCPQILQKYQETDEDV